MDWKHVDPQWAWAPYEPSREAPWNLERAAHLFRRAAFGANWQQLQQALEQGPQQTVRQLLQGGGEQHLFYQQMEQVALATLGNNQPGGLPPWWLYMMRFSPHPLRERVALFWHDHFATSAAKVDAWMMWQQNQLFRRLGLGPFGTLLEQVSKDPAMMVWLDGALNRRRHPNENFAREVMELFTLGLGNYTERDIKEAARAFTGWSLRRGRFYYDPEEHDPGIKVVLGRRGRWQGDDVLRILLEHPATARHLATKWCRYLVAEDAPWPRELIEPLAREYRRREYDTAWLLSTVLQSNLFFSPLAIRHKVKSPVDFALGLLVALEGTTNFEELDRRLTQLGQRLFFPPNVAGWDRGRAWLNSATLIGRLNLAWDLASQSPPQMDLPELASRYGINTVAQATQWLHQLLLGSRPDGKTQVQLVAAATGGRSSPRSAPDRAVLARAVHAVAALPRFQLA